MHGILKATVCLAALSAAAVAHAQVPVEQLANPPADARRFLIVTPGGVLGTSAAWTLPDGTLMARDSMNLRGQKFEMDEAVRLGPDGAPASMVVRGFTPNGDAAETFTVSAGKASWKSQLDAGSAPYAAPAVYVPAGGGFIINQAILVEALLKAPGKSIALLPGGRASAEKLTELQIGEGPKKITVVCWAINGLGNSPIPAWATQDGKFFGAGQGSFGIYPAEYESSVVAIGKAQDDAMAARSPAMVKSLLKTPAGPVAFVHVRAFLDGQRFADDQTVVVDKGLITRIGPAALTPAPAGAQVIDGKGETLVPGLWDSHQHFGDDFTGPFLLSMGVTSVRDPGNDNALTIARAARRANGQLLSPKVYPSSLIDGKGPNTAQVATVVNSLDEAIAAVDKAKADGFIGVKFYGTFKPEWVQPAAAEAHRLGLHVHGHLPAGMRPHEAIAAGYDEVTHINFVMMEAMPDEVVKVSNGIARFEGTGKLAKDVDLNAPPMKSLIALMAQHHIVSDPTLVVFETMYVPENGDLAPEYSPFLGTLPPATERNFRQGGFVPPKGYTRDDYRKSFAKLLELVGAMHKAGVPIVAGTDGSGLELIRELDLYVQAGFTPAEALAAATIEPAKNVHADATTGSITVGKAADLVLVEGDPSRHITDLRNTRVVMMGGKLMDADALRAASGFSGRPKPVQ